MKNTTIHFNMYVKNNQPAELIQDWAYMLHSCNWGTEQQEHGVTTVNLTSARCMLSYAISVLQLWLHSRLYLEKSLFFGVYRSETSDFLRLGEDWQCGDK